MDLNKRRKVSSIASWRISRSKIVLPRIFFNDSQQERTKFFSYSRFFFKYSNQRRETRMNDLGLIQGNVEIARLANGRRKARYFRKHKQASRGIIFFYCLLGPL
jgi:hypothetical protein